MEDILKHFDRAFGTPSRKPNLCFDFGPRDTGFRLHFANGYTVSVQWGEFNYCDERTAEVGAFNKEGWYRSQLIDWPDDDVCGNCTPEQVAIFIQEVSQLEAK